MKSPIFIFSLPRSGSTLLQRILMSHKDIASVAETFLLLPFVYATKKEGQLSEYCHHCTYAALEDLINNLPNKENDYRRFLAEFSNKIYESLCPKNEIYFLDKTPRYYLIIPEIAKIFPDAKFIFLFRNPVHIYSSLITSWGDRNRFDYPLHHTIDLTMGPELLSKGYGLLKEKSYAIKYEDFLENPEKYLKEISSYLDLPYDKSVLENFSNQDIKGRSGDPTGVKDYKKLDTKPLEKWKSVFNTQFRKKVLKKYIQNIDENVFETAGYSKEDILKEINNLEISYNRFLKDRIDYILFHIKKYIKKFNHRRKNWKNSFYLS